MANAQQRGWGNPDAPDFRRKNITTIEVAGIRLAVHRAVAHLFVGLICDIHAQGYDFAAVQDDWGYANRCQRGTGPGTSRPCVKSNHSWGLAIDLNATRNPMRARHPAHANHPGHDASGMHTDMPPNVDAIARRWHLFWGGNYRNTPDAMHFEYLGTPADVPTAPQRRPAPSPGRVYPIYDYEEDSVRATIVDVKVGPDGKGWNAWDTGKAAPIPSGCVLSGLRPKPVAQGGDGKYPGYAGITPSVAVEKQWLLVAVEGAPPGTVIPVYVSVA